MPSAVTCMENDSVGQTLVKKTEPAMGFRTLWQFCVALIVSLDLLCSNSDRYYPHHGCESGKFCLRSGKSGVGLTGAVAQRQTQAQGPLSQGEVSGVARTTQAQYKKCRITKFPAVSAWILLLKVRRVTD